MANEIDPFAPNSTTSYGDPALDAFFRVGDYAPAPPEAPQGVADIEQYMPRKEPTKYEPKGITSGILSDPDYLRYLEAVEQKQKIPTGLLQAIIAKESSGNPNAVSPADAQGLHGWGAGQFRNSTAKDVASRTGIPIWQNGKVNMDPYVQAEAMAALLQMKRQAVGGDWGDAAWAYNAGEGNVLSYKQGKGYSQYADRVDPRYKNEVLANRDAVLQLRGSQATPAATQPQEAQPETYDIPLSDGSILHAPVGMPREEALKQAKEVGLAAEGLRDIPLASGAILHAPESMSDEDAIAQAKAAAPDMDFTTIHESKTGFVPGFKSAATALGSQALRGVGEMAQGAGQSFGMPKIQALGEEAITKSKELDTKAAGMAEKPTEKDSAFTRYLSQPAGEVTGSILPLLAGAAVAPEATVPALLGGTLTSQVIGSQAQRGEAAGKGDYDISENLPYSIPEIGINYAANVLGPLKSVFKSRLADELLSADADKLIRNIAKTEGFDAAKEAVGSKISNIAQEYGVNLGSMAFGDISSAILERASAGEELTSPDAMEEYWNNFTTDLVGAGLFGAPQGIGRRAAKEAAVDKLGAELRGAARFPEVPPEETRLKAEEATAKRLAEEQLPPTGEQLPPTGEQLPPTGEQLPPTGEQLPPTGEQLPPTGEQLPPTGEQLPPTGEQLPPTGEQLPPTGEQLPPTGEQLPPTGEQLPPTGEQLPPTGEQLPPTGEQLPPTGEQLPPTGEQLPPTGEQLPPTGEQLPPTGEQQPPTGEQQPPTGVQFPAPEGTAWQDTLGLTKSKAPGSIYNRLLQLDIEDPEHYTYIKSILDEIGKKPGIKHDSQAIENLYNYIGAKPTEEMVKAREEFAGKMGFEARKETDQTGRTTAPLFAAKSETLKKGVDAKDVPATLTALGQSKNPVIRWVAEKAKNITNLTVRSDDSAIRSAEKQLGFPKGSVGGFYNSGTDELVMRSRNADSEHVVGHELLHGLTARTINNISAKLKANIALDKTEKKQLPAYNGLVKLYDAVKTHPTLAKDYGARENVKEFVSEGLSNPEFQYKLSRIKYENTTMWGKFTQSLANMLGLKRDNAFMELVTHVENLAPKKPTKPKAKAITPSKIDISLLPEKARADKDTQTAEIDVSRRTQPKVRQEGEGAPVSGEGVREGRQEGRATEKVEVDKAPPRLGAPTPKEELTERAIKRVLHREKTGEDIWVPGLGNKQVQATIRKLLTQRDSGEITEEQMHGRLNSLLDQITLKSEERKFTEKDRVRGADFIRQRLLEAKRKGLLSERAVDMAEWFIKKNPKLLDDLGISTKIETPKDMEGTAGYYTKLNRVMTLISENVKDSTAVHEILHHLERMMPSNIRAGISKAWLKSVMDAKKKAEKAGDEKLVSFLNATLTGDQKLIEETFRKLSREQALDQYHHFNPSEFWAVNGTRILENRYDSSPAFLKRLATWLREFGQHVKGALGLKSDAPILRAIDVMLKEKTPEYRSQRLLGEEVGRKQMTLAASYVGEKPKDLKPESDPNAQRLVESGIVKTETSDPKGFVNQVIKWFKRSNMDFGTRVRAALVTRYAPWTTALRNQEWIDIEGQIRADAQASSFQQIFNTISTGYKEGPPVVGPDGVVRIVSDPNLALGKVLDRIDGLKQFNNPRHVVSAVLRALRGEEILKADEATRRQIASLRAKADTAMAASKAAKKREDIIKYDNEAKSLRKEAKALEDTVGKMVGEGREKVVTQPMIDDARDIMNSYADVAKIVADMHNINRALVDLWENAGLVDAETVTAWRDNPSYIPLYKSQEDILSDPASHIKVLGAGTKSVGEIKTLMGGTHEVNVLENMQRHYAFMTTAAAQNLLRKNASYQLERVGVMRRISKQEAANNPLAIMFKENGEKSYYECDDPVMFEAFQASIPLTHPFFTRFTQPMARFFRAATLVNPVFWYKQIIRDPIHASIVGGTGIITPLDAAAAFTKILRGKSETYKTLSKEGVVGAIDSLTDPKKFAESFERKKGAWNKFKDTAMHLHESADAATRVAVYDAAHKDAINRGYTSEKAHTYATMKAREVINFSNQGKSQAIQVIRATVPFFSAAINSLDVVARAASGLDVPPAERAAAKKMFYSRIAALSAMSAGYAMLMQDDEEYKKLQNANDWAMNWLIPTGNKQNPFVKVPVSFELGIPTKILPELWVRLNAGTLTAREAKKVALQAVQSALPPLPIPLVFKTPLETVMNYDLFTHRTIEGRGEENKLIEDRVKGASGLAKYMSKDLGLSGLGLSPAKIEHLGHGLGTELWAASTLLADAYLNKDKVTPIEPLSKSLPLAHSLLTKPDTERMVNLFYEIEADAKQVHMSMVGKRNAGKIEEFKADMADPEKAKLFRAAKPLRNIADNMAKINRQMERVKNTQTMTREEMTAELDRLKNIYNNMAVTGYQIAKKLGVD